MVTNYQINSNNMTDETERTTAISMISYDIENANDNDLTKSDVNDQMENLKETNQFPSNLEYVDSYTDPNTDTTSTAFLNQDTGKVTVGMAGTNVHIDQLKNTDILPI
ncbi:hypothetical protein BTJ66_04915 [Staphylococcus edaphicus]|uniref:Uncharacterized protein n=1 Tax=Staphylococcus edaphicus TaxID=1955013 RepID=A0A2C6WQS5_9STAP|nr:hypothetical protein BTJ66_04915 [Staphylococcus edaphicus]